MLQNATKTVLITGLKDNLFLPVEFRELIKGSWFLEINSITVKNGLINTEDDVVICLKCNACLNNFIGSDGVKNLEKKPLQIVLLRKKNNACQIHRFTDKLLFLINPQNNEIKFYIDTVTGNLNPLAIYYLHISLYQQF